MHIEVSGRQFNFPSQCACCNRPADASLTVSASKSTGKRVVHTKTHSWDFPYCSACLGHKRAGETAGTVAVLLGIGAFFGSAILFFVVATWLGVTVGVIGIAAAVLSYTSLMANARKLCSPECACVMQAVAFVDWDGARQVFEIGSRDYAVAFMRLNQRKLVNLSPEALQLLQSVGGASHVGGQQAAQKFER